MANVWINEFHYDNSGTADENEFIEIAAPVGTLAGWKVVLYNGNNPQNVVAYNTITLTEAHIVEEVSNGYGFITINFPRDGIQNGSADGIALINPAGDLIEFISYEGQISITHKGEQETSTDIGVSEDGESSATGSIQRQGSGRDSKDFTWVLEDTTDQATPNDLNKNQTITSPLPTLSIAAASADKAEDADAPAEFTEFTFTVTRSSTEGSPRATWSLTGIGGAGQASLADFIDPVRGTVEFEGNSLTATITIRVAADAEYELDETFSVILSEPVGATIANGTADGQIDNDDVATTETN